MLFHLLIIMWSIICSFSVGINVNLDEIKKSNQFEVSAKAEGLWLLNYNFDYKDPGVYWFMNEINNNFCGHNIGIYKLLKEKFKMEFADDYINYQYINLLNASEGGHYNQ